MPMATERTSQPQQRKKPRPQLDSYAVPDLQRQFLELQWLRERVRIAQCGRTAATFDGTYRELRRSA
jgi:hypothetical protein